MSSIQERLQLKRVPLDTWNIREKLFLASAVVRSGDQNWMSVSRALKTMGEPNRPPDWYSQKSCAAQYGALLEHVETPKRKKRNSEGGVETPQESILKCLMQQRILEIQENLKEMNKQNERLASDIAELRNTSTPDERIQELYADMETAKRAREKENARRAAWLKEREERRARTERPWRPSQTPPSTPTSAPPSSPLLTSLLKSSPVVTTPQHIPHPASIVDTISPSAGAPTLSLLLEHPHAQAQESKHAAIEHIKSQLVQIEHQLKANSQSTVPAVDIDDIEIKAEDVYAFRDIDIHIPPVLRESGTLHKGVRVHEKPTPKKEDEIIPEPEITEAVPIAEEIKQEQIPEPMQEEVMAAPEIETVKEPPIQETQEEIPVFTPEAEAEVKIVFPEVKFPTPEIKVIQPDEQKVKEETKEPEVVQEQEEEIVEEKEEAPAVEETVEEPVITEEAIEKPEEPAPIEPIPEAVPEPEPVQEQEPQPEPEVPETIPELPDPQDIPLPDEEPKEQSVEIPPPPEVPVEVTEPEESAKIDIKEEIEEQVVEEKKDEENVVDDKKDEDAEDSIPLKDMIKEESLQDAVKKEEAIEEDTHTETDDDTPMELSREEEKDGKKKRDYSRKKKSDSRTCSGSESAPESPSASDAERQHRMWKKSVMLVYSRLCAHKYASLFLRPITDEEAPGYSIVVKKPVDLTQIRRDIDAGNIRTTAQFQRAVLLMLSNALMYNSSSHSVYSMTKEMHEEAQCQLNMLVAAQAHAGLCAPRRKRRRYALD